MKLLRVFIILVLLAATGVLYVIINSSDYQKTARSSPVYKHFQKDLSTSQKFPDNGINTEKQVRQKWEGHTEEADEWGERVSGVRNRIETDEKVVALTFDACGGPFGDEYDEELIDFLREESIPATLFFNARWITSNEQVFKDLADDPLFSVQNHGTEHLPLSIAGKTAWGIEGTGSVEEVIDEIMINQSLIEEMTGESPEFFRSGTAYYDNIAIKVIEDLGLTAVNYDVLGDAGATYSAEQVKESLLSASPGSIPLLHMNQPSSGTAEGVKKAIPELKAAGYSFVLLDGQKLTE
ncbi:polysaccharide deacetylase family protein [Salipaludibacillus aurantiacus]|uniref:Peptidoglycan/xylan/chitin deacetylase, PgdA/CDA1 family n=1 Tax=Salipaludibacillus aurantiacus TaxID=1601833 RepID=A0A1H9WK80_9BACI|nr:polysaccharide deacetylase family protein [Salipaludibacillus aurantiacus]SES34077.1 Peptidoglycan/xylan/chitin deacetylase, PgdA/CDA1 family [Salipaludibacillus aurantiacus]